MAFGSVRFLRKLAKPSLRGLCSSLGLVGLVFLAGCNSTFYQLFSEGSQVVEAVREATACSPQLLSLRLGVKADPAGGLLEQAYMEEVIAELEHRLDSFGLKGYEISQWGEDSVELFVDASVDDAVLVKALIEDAELEMRPQRAGTVESLQAVRLKVDGLQGELFQTEGLSTGLYDPQAVAELQNQLELAQAELLALYDEPQLRTEDVEEAYASVEGASGAQWSVAVDFTPQAADKFAELTRNLAGTGRSLGLWVNGELIAVPMIDGTFAEEGITGGSAVISGNFTAEDAKALAVQLNGRPLPVALALLEQQIVNNPDCPRES